jgi:hypothetical protein
MVNNLVDDTMTEITPYKESVIRLYKEQRAERDAITVDINDEYTDKLKAQLLDFKEVINKNIDKANEEKTKLNKALDEMDKEFYDKLGLDGDEYVELAKLEEFVSEKQKVLNELDDTVETKDDILKEIEKAEARIAELRASLDSKSDTETQTASSPEDIDGLINDVFNQGYEESHKLYLIEQFIETKKIELNTIDDMIKEIDNKSDTLKKAIVSSKVVVNMLYDITKDEAMVAQWKDDFAKIQAKSKEDDCDDWVTILKYCSMTKSKKEVLELQNKMNETVQALLAAYKEYVTDEDAQKIEAVPEINWYGADRTTRYKEFDIVIQYMRDKLHRAYLENQANLPNEKLKEIKSLIFNTDYLCLSKELRDTRLIEAFTIPDPVSRYAYRVNILTKPIMEGLYSKLIDNAYEFALYTMSIIREPNAFWLVFLLAGEM